MVSEASTNTQKRIRRRAMPPDPRELLDSLDMVDTRLLRWLLRYPFQRTEDLALATGRSIATVYRHLGVLHDRCLIERVMPATLGTTACWLYHLSNLGLQVLAVREQVDPIEMTRTQKSGGTGCVTIPIISPTARN